VRNVATLLSFAFFIFWTSFIAGFGVVVLQDDISGKAATCSKTYQIPKYVFLNVCLMLGILFSYFLWKGGGEGARARALLILVLHFALAGWGFMLWQRMDKECSATMEVSNQRTTDFNRLSAIQNAFFVLIYAFHEFHFGVAMQADYTVFVEIIGFGDFKSTTDYPQFTPSDFSKYQEIAPPPQGLPPEPAPDPTPHGPPGIS